MPNGLSQNLKPSQKKLSEASSKLMGLPRPAHPRISPQLFRAQTPLETLPQNSVPVKRERRNRLEMDI
jgi:hypothetical protein